MFFTLTAGQIQAANGPESSRPRRVLLIFSELKDLPGNAMMEQGVRSEMLKGSTNRIEFFSESLDANRFSNSEQYKAFKDYLRNKYAAQKPDLVILFMVGSFLLMQEVPPALMSNVPVVFVMVNDLATPDLPAQPPSTGIIHRYDIHGTLQFMFHLQPETRHVVVIGGTTVTDRAMLGRIVDAARSVDGVEFEFWTNRPVADMVQAARSLPSGTTILLSMLQRDITGEPIRGSQFAQILAPASSVPVYVMGAGLLGNGTLGGEVVDFENLGASAGTLASRTLAGTPVTEIPVEVRSNGTPMVDWRALTRWRISQNRLPEDCVIRYRPRSLWADHRNLILAGGAALLAQAITIVALLAQLKLRRRAEAEIQKQQTELAHVARLSTMGQLASALTHELNQPLGAILRNTEAAEIFLQKAQPDLNEVRAILTDIRKDDQRAGEVIDRMRALLKRRSLVSEPIDLRELAEDTVALARPDARSREVKITLETPSHLPPARGDRVHLQQVLLNLILNGMDAMIAQPPEQRVLVVRVRAGQDHSLEVAVTDAGTGISPADKARVFEPFFTTKAQGMGMGLALSRTIIEAHGGSIRAENNATTGATFTFTLPRAERAEPIGRRAPLNSESKS